MTPSQLKANDITHCEGVSTWLTTLPFKEEGFALSKIDHRRTSSSIWLGCSKAAI